MPAQRAAMTPVSADERIATLDILRGFALGGILLVNMAFFSMPVMHAIGIVPAPGTALDKAVHTGIFFLAQGKFLSLFSFLFGLGFSIQLARAAARGASAAKFYARRMAVLLAIGAAHAFLIWGGDILMLYAVLGFVLILFRNRKPRTLLVWAVALILIPITLTVVFVGLSNLETKEETAKEAARSAAVHAQEVERAQRVYQRGSYLEMVRQRAHELGFFFFIIVFFMAPNALAMFLLGVWAGKKEIFREVSLNAPFLRKVRLWGFVVGVIGNGLDTWLMVTGNREVPDWTTAIASLGSAFGVPALSMCYASAVALLAQDPAWARRLRPLAAMGRMALTNYLLQSLICTTIFYSYGLALFGHVGFAAGLVFWIVIYVVQMPLSLWWLSQFKMGPAEWVWRTLTYGKPQPMRA